MKFGLNQAGFPADDFAETCEIVSSAGYDGVEPNYTTDGRITTEDGRRDMKRIATDYGLDIPAVSTILHWEYPLSSTDEETRQRGIQLGKSMIDAAAAFDADDVLIVPAAIEPETPYEQAYDLAMDSMTELVRYAANHDVTVAVENVQNNFLYSPGEFEQFVSTLSDVGPVGVYLDVGNGFRWGLPNRWIRELGDWISKVHVKDWRKESHVPTYPLQGDIDWNSVCEALADIRYDGWISAEVPAYQSHPHRMPRQVLDNMTYLFDPIDANTEVDGA